MKFHIITLFPEMFDGPLTMSIMKRARQKRLLEIDFLNPRRFATDKHRRTDAPQYGGGAGMVMMAPPLFSAVESIKMRYSPSDAPPVALTTPQGETFSHQIAQRFALLPALIIVCGRYEGIDERFVQHGVDREISIGDFVITGGEIAAMAIIDAVARLLPGVLGDDESAKHESFAPLNDGMLEGPVYTRPANYRGWRVPEELLTGNHAAVEAFRRREAAARTEQRRPDLMRGWGPYSQAEG